MAITPESESSPAAVLRAAGRLIASVSERLSAGLTDDEVIVGVEEVQQLSAKLAGVQARLVAEAHQRDLARKKLRWGSTADWVTHCAGIHRREGGRVVRHAVQLVNEQAVTLAAMDRGETSPVQASVICDAVDGLPSDRDLRSRAEKVLNEQAMVLTATELTKAARHVVQVVDPDGVERRDEAALDRLERAAHRGRFLSVVDDGAGGVRIKGGGSVEDGEVLRAALLPLTKPSPAVDPDDPTCETERDPRDHGARMWDALIQTAQHSLDTELPPESHGTRPRVVITTEYEKLVAGLGDPCPTETGLELSVAAVRRLACHADVIPGVLGSDGQILDVGRAARLVTAVIWVALVLRDRHCAFPGCTRPPSMCHAHHIVHWVDGGPTSLSNLVLLCGEHHRTIHHTPWQVRLRPDDRLPEFLPPPRLGGHQPEWTRHRARRE
jgi:hypothetical protein